MKTKDTTSSSRIAIMESDFPSIPLLILACYLAKVGHRVSVYTHEDIKSNKVIQNKKLRFGPAWLIPELALKEFYKDFGIALDDALSFKKSSVNYKIFFDNSEFTIDSIKDTKYLFSQFEPGAGIELENYLRDTMKMSAKIERKGWNYIRLDGFYSSLNSHRRKLNAIFCTDELRRIMCIIPELFFSSYRLPKVSQAINYLVFMGEHGRIDSKPDALFESILNIAKQCGVKFYTNKNLKSIKLGEDNSHKVVIGKRTLKFDYLIHGGNRAKFQEITNKEEIFDKNTLKNQKVLWQWSLMLDKKIPNLEFHNIFIDNTIQKFIQSKAIKLMKRKFKQPTSVYIDYYDTANETGCTNICINMTLFRVFVDDLEAVARLKELIFDCLATRLQFDVRRSVLDEQEKVLELAPASQLNQMIGVTKYKNFYELKPPISLEVMIAQAIYSSKKFSEQI